MLLITVIDERVEAIDGLDEDIAAPATVATVWSSELDEFLASERHAALTAVAGANVNLGFIEKFHGTRNMGSLPPKRQNPRVNHDAGSHNLTGEHE